MSRYIDTEKLCQKILDVEDYYKAKNNSNIEARIKYDFLINVVTPMVVGTPTEDVAPVVHAKWIEDVYQDEPYVCSNCGWAENDDMHRITGGYCVCCGAKMDEET